MKQLSINKRHFAAFGAIFAVTVVVAFALARASYTHPALAESSHIVELKSGRAEPSAIAVTKGDYVQFDSRDGKTHNIGQGKGDNPVHKDAHHAQHEHLSGGQESGTFGPKQGYRVQFNQTGTYDFHDHLNPKISITVVVYEPGIPAK